MANDFRSARFWAQELIEKALFDGARAADATMGNGHDAQWLCELVGESGRVFAFDVQPEAVARTRQRLTDAGVLLPCPGCGGDNVVDWYRYNEVWYQCDDCGWQGKIVYSEGFADTEQTKKARRAWNTRAPILSESELKKLEETI